MLGPLFAGVAIQVLGSQFHSTHGYAAMWIVSSGAILASIPVLGRLGGDVERRRRQGASPRSHAAAG
jgi:hypothetical protein